MIPEIKALIIEDDKKSADYLTSLLASNFEQINIVGYSDSVKGSIHLINSLKPEIVFMDIMLTDGNAFQILDAITYTDFETIFVTSHTDFFEEAMKRCAFNYTLKPLNLTKVETVVNKYEGFKKRILSLNKYQMFSEFVKERTSKFLIQVNSQHIAINIDDIIKCTAEGNYTYFNMLGGKKFLASKTLKYYENLLIHKGFFKAHRSILVNISFIKSIYKREAIALENGDKIIISRRNKTHLNSLIEQLS